MRERERKRGTFSGRVTPQEPLGIKINLGRDSKVAKFLSNLFLYAAAAARLLLLFDVLS